MPGAVSLTTDYDTFSNVLSGLFKEGTTGWSFMPQITLADIYRWQKPGQDNRSVDKELLIGDLQWGVTLTWWVHDSVIRTYGARASSKRKARAVNLAQLVSQCRSEVCWVPWPSVSCIEEIGGASFSLHM